jgi:hypothetical protein
MGRDLPSQKRHSIFSFESFRRFCQVVKKERQPKPPLNAAWSPSLLITRTWDTPAAKTLPRFSLNRLAATIKQGHELALCSGAAAPCCQKRGVCRSQMSEADQREVKIGEELAPHTTAQILAIYENKLATRRRLAHIDPTNPQWRCDEAGILTTIGIESRNAGLSEQYALFKRAALYCVN